MKKNYATRHLINLFKTARGNIRTLKKLRDRPYCTFRLYFFYFRYILIDVLLFKISKMFRFFAYHKYKHSLTDRQNDAEETF